MNLIKAQPVAQTLTEHDKAAQKKKKLVEAIQSEQTPKEKKREEKFKDKRELAIEKALKD